MLFVETLWVFSRERRQWLTRMSYLPPEHNGARAESTQRLLEADHSTEGIFLTFNFVLTHFISVGAHGHHNITLLVHLSRQNVPLDRTTNQHILGIVQKDKRLLNRHVIPKI